MLSFDYCQPEDKDFGYYATHEEDPCQDLFDRYLNHDLPQCHDNVEESDGFDTFNFAFDEDTTSGDSFPTDSDLTSTGSSVQVPVSNPLEYIPSTLQLRAARSEHSTKAISRNELLNLEGKREIEPQPAANTPPTSSGASAIPTLRRKPKFCASDLEIPRCRSQRIPKTPSNKMMQSSDYFPHSMGPSHDWTQRFEQINLQGSMVNLASSPPNETLATEHRRRLNGVSTPDAVHSPQHSTSKRFLEHKATSSQATPSLHVANGGLGVMNHALHDPVDSKTGFFAENNIPSTTNQQRTISGSAFQQPRQSSSWVPPPNNFSMYSPTASPSHVHPSWLHNLSENNEAYYDNGTTPHSAQDLVDPISEFSTPGLMIHYDPYGQIIPTDTTATHPFLPADHFRPIKSEHISPPHLYTNSTTSLPHPQTPPPYSRSPSPPLKSPSKSLCRKTHTKKPSLNGILKSAKSSPGLNKTHHKSTPSLNSQRSTPHMRSPLKSPKTPGVFTFQNFGPEDSGKILTGVAPSGSSKTKERREREAAEKKRRLSLAAMKAVEEAGGDVEGLEGLL